MLERVKLHTEGPQVGAQVSIPSLSVIPAQALDIQVQRAFRESIPAPLSVAVESSQLRTQTLWNKDQSFPKCPVQILYR